MKTVGLLLALTLFAGCKSGGSAPPVEPAAPAAPAAPASSPTNAGGHCDVTISSAIDRMMEQQMKESADKMTPDQKKTVEDMANELKPKMKAALAKSCTDDKWSADALTCMDDAKTMMEMEKCESKLTPEQKMNSDKAIQEAVGRGAGGDGAGAAPAGGQ
jgi:hypothetical protein